jgi:hypothetical protein
MQTQKLIFFLFFFLQRVSLFGTNPQINAKWNRHRVAKSDKGEKDQTNKREQAAEARQEEIKKKGVEPPTNSGGD